MKLYKNSLLFRKSSLAFFSLLAITSNNALATGTLVEGDPEITICHYPSSDINNPVTMTIPKSEWATHRADHGDATHKDLPGACGILANESCLANSLTIYGMNDDSDGIAVYKLDDSEVVALTPAIEFPDELESLTASQGETYYAIQSGIPENTSGPVGFYQITLKQNESGTFTGDYLKVFDLPPGGFHSIELIDGDFYTANNDDNKWIKFSLDGTILAERSFVASMAAIPSEWRTSSIEDTAYDPVNQILYASQVWDSDQKGYSHLLAFDLSNGFDNMIAVDKGSMWWEKIEGLLFKDGILYAASDHDNKIFKIIQDENGYIVGDGRGEDISGWDSELSSDVEGMANAFLLNCSDPEDPEPPVTIPPLNFGNHGRFNIKEINEHKVN